MGVEKYAAGFQLALHEDALEVPLTWKQPKLIFVNSMSDLFHKDVPLSFIERVFEVMRKAHWHQFQMLTKRSDILLELSPRLRWPDNVWMGVSVESQAYRFRIDDLRRIGARTKFLSLEPLLGPLTRLNLRGIDWVIVGGESGPGARPISEHWVLDIRDQCLHKGVPFFFKQWGGINKKRSGRSLQGRTWDQIPVSLLHLSSMA
jgi:protein gp37